jgi:hypothetical protein
MIAVAKVTRSGLAGSTRAVIMATWHRASGRPPARTPPVGAPVNGWPQSSWDETETLDCAIDAAKYGTGLRGPRQRTDDSELGAPRVCHRLPGAR